MSMERIMPRKQRGFTLTEAAIVLGIVGLILGAIWVAAAAVYNNLRVSTTSNQLLQMVQSIRSMHATQQTMGTGTGTDIVITLAQAGAIPKDMLDDATNPTAVRNVWSGAVLVRAATSAELNGSVAESGFRIQMAGVPRTACSDILVRNTGSGRDSGLMQAGTTTSIMNSWTAGDFPISVTDATTACNDATNNTLVFTFSLKT